MAGLGVTIEAMTNMHALPENAPAPSTSTKPGRPLRPENDPFLAAPADLALLAPGSVIRSREIDVAFLGLVSQQVSAKQLAYRSTDLHGVPEVAITTVLLPLDADPAEPRPLLAHQCAIDAISSKCFPSYAFQKGAHSLGAIPPLELLLLTGMLRRGWALSVCDHEGLEGRFGAAREPGYRVLDGIRATLNFDPLGFDPDTKVGLFGYSGGGMATSWAAEMAPTYAPELNIVGAALGSPVGDPGQTFLRLNSTFFAGLPAMVVGGLLTGYPGLSRVIHEHASFMGRQHLLELTRLSTFAAIAKYRGNDFDDYVDAPLADVLATPEVLEVFEDLRLGHNIPTCPLLMMHSVHDQIIHVDDIDGQHERYVDGGATVHYIRDRASEHIVLHPLGFPLVLEWLTNRFEGKPAPTGTKTVLSVALSLRSLLGYVEMASAAIRTVVGAPIRQRKPRSV